MRQIVERLRVLELKVAEVDNILASLEDARVVKHLNGDQRRQLAEACVELSQARKQAQEGTVEITAETAVKILRCIGATQDWLAEMFASFASVGDRRM